jgi:hypothetical protein
MLRTIENRVLTKKLGLQRRKILETGENRTKSSFMTFSLNNIRLNRSMRMAELCVRAYVICLFVLEE